MIKKICKGFCLCVCAVLMAISFTGCKNGKKPEELAKVPETPTYAQTSGDFIITLTASKTTFSRGENIEVVAVFENLRGGVIDIRHNSFF